MFDLKNFKVRLNSEAESRAVQALVIANGGKWANQMRNDGFVAYVQHPYIFVRNNIMTYESDHEGEYFESDGLAESEFDFETVLTAKHKPMKTVSIFGLTYPEKVVRALLEGKHITSK